MESREIQSAVRFSSKTKAITLIVGLVAFVALLLRVQRVLGPFVWGGILAYVFTPLVDWLETRTRLRRVWVVVLLYLVGLAAAAWAATALVPALVKQASEFVQDSPRILGSLVEQLALFTQYLQQHEIRVGTLPIDPQMLVNEAMTSARGVVTYLTSHVLPAVFNVLEAVGQSLLCLIVAFYLLRSWRDVRTGMPRLIPRPYRSEALGLFVDIDRVLGAYIRGQLMLIGIMAVAIFVALSILRIRYALVIALLSGILEVIPLIGPFLAGGIAVSVALFQPYTPFGWSNLTLALAVVVAYTVLRQVEDQVIVPNVVGPIVDLHPLLVLFALFAGGTLAGFTGLVVAVPLAAALKIVIIYLYGKIWDERPAEDRAAASPPAAAADTQPASGETA